MTLLFEAMFLSERLYDSSIGVLSDCLTRGNEEAVVADTDTLADETALLRILVGGTNNTLPVYEYNSDGEEDEEEISSQDLVMRIQERMRQDKAKEAEKNDPAEGKQSLVNKSKLDLLCSHEQYGLDLCWFLLSPKSPVHAPDQCPQDSSSNPADEDQIVPENDSKDDDEAWFGIHCDTVICGKYLLQADEKTAETVANSESSKDGASTVSGSNGDSTISSEAEDEAYSRAIVSSTVPQNSLVAHLRSLTAKNRKEYGGLDCGRLDFSQSIISGEIQIRTEALPEPAGLSMTEPSDDDYLMLIQADPKGTSFCSDASSVGDIEKAEEALRLRPAQELRAIPTPAPKAKFSPRNLSSSKHKEPDGATQGEIEKAEEALRLRPAQKLRAIPTPAPKAKFSPRNLSSSKHKEPDSATQGEIEKAEEALRLRPAQKLRVIPTPAPKAKFSPRILSSSKHAKHEEPDGATQIPLDEEEISIQSECQVMRDAMTNGIELIHMEAVAADRIQETESVSSSRWSQRALLDDDHDSILNEDSLEFFREPDGTKFSDIAVSTDVAEDEPSEQPLSADNIIEAMSDDGTPGEHEELLDEASAVDPQQLDDDSAKDSLSEILSEPFDETQDNFRSSPRQRIRKELAAIDGARTSFELPATRAPKTNIQKRLNLMERLRSVSDDDTDMLCACVQGCGDYADATFFEDSVDETSQDENTTVEQFSLD